MDGHLVLGSWVAKVESDRESYARLLWAHFRQETVAEPPLKERGPDAQIRLEHCDWNHPAFADNDRIADDCLEAAGESGDRLRLATSLVRLSCWRDNGVDHLRMLLAGGEADAETLGVHFAVTMRRGLLWFGLLHLHAGAVEWLGRVNLFIGQKGAGKTTLCLRLAREGARILSEDHLLVKRTGSGFVVSGADRVTRITEASERFLFTEVLPGEARDFAGTTKKEVAVAGLFACDLFRDYPIHRVFFSHVEDAFRVRKMSEREAVVRMITDNRRSFRFSKPAEYGHYLEYFSGMVAGKQIYDLALSRSLGALDQLVEFLRSG